MLPRINWKREKFCKHPSTNEEHGLQEEVIEWVLKMKSDNGKMAD